MPNSLTALGLTISTQQELLANEIANMQRIYGNDIDLSSNTRDGQRVNIDIQAQLDMLFLMQAVYNSFDPDLAIGVTLDQRCAINGVQRQAGTFSITNITIVTTQEVTLYGLDQSTNPVYTVADNIGNQWFLQSTQNAVGPGTIIASFRAATPGANVTQINTITVMSTVVIGVVSVNNPTAQTVRGINEESDAELRIRRQISVAMPSQGKAMALRAALLNINGISSAFVYENKTNFTDADGIPGHSIWAIVQGFPNVGPFLSWSSTINYSYGQLVSVGNTNYISWKDNNLNNNPSSSPSEWGIYNPVAMEIYFYRNLGCGMKGDTSYNVIQKDGTLFTVQYDNVVSQNMFISFTATSINGVSPPNIAGIVNALVNNYMLGVSDEANINQVACISQQADPNTLVTNAGLSLALTQIANLSGIAASGTFEFSYNGNDTAAINWNDSTATIQTKLRTLAGLNAAVVTGTIAGQTLTITLGVVSALGLITVKNNTLQTSAPAAITFSFNEGYQNILAPSTKKNILTVSADKIIILPMILSPTSVSVPVSTINAQIFKGLGGYGTLTYSMQANPSGGSINASTGEYSSGATPATDVAKVTDAFGNTATATIGVN